MPSIAADRIVFPRPTCHTAPPARSTTMMLLLKPADTEPSLIWSNIKFVFRPFIYHEAFFPPLWKRNWLHLWLICYTYRILKATHLCVIKCCNIQSFRHSAIIQGDQKVSVHLTITVQYTIVESKMAITENIRNVDRAILNTVFENTFWRVKKYLETGGGHFEHYL